MLNVMVDVNHIACKSSRRVKNTSKYESEIKTKFVVFDAGL